MGDYHRTFAILSASLLLSPTPNALAEDPDSAVLVDEDSIEEIVVTGSRIKRSTYTSIAPLQILTSDSSRQFGLIDTAAVLQESSPASGMQVDLTMQGFVTANGPGASTISLRGLGQERTLVLINGRRLAPAGVEGAPTAADLNLVPSAFVRQYDLLLDGASSVYGSDAIAGVTNIILRNDFDGLEVGAWHNMPRLSGGQETTLSAAWGTEWSSGYFGTVPMRRGRHYEAI